MIELVRDEVALGIYPEDALRSMISKRQASVVRTRDGRTIVMLRSCAQIHANEKPSKSGSVGECIGTLKTTYDEDLGGGRHLLMMKRTNGHEFRKWDPNLSFLELRAGRMISEKTVQQRIANRSI